jgi:DnaJ family protein C protein 8
MPDIDDPETRATLDKDIKEHEGGIKQFGKVAPRAKQSVAKDDDDAVFAALDKEAKEFDKVSLLPPNTTYIPSQVTLLTRKQDAEIDRILKAFRLDAYAVLDLQPGVPESDIKIAYRKKSLLIHPDKTSNPRAPDAFDRLKKAQTELSDEKHRERLDEAIADARMLLIREKKWTIDTPELQGDAFKVEWREKAKEVLIDNEMRRRKQIKAQMQEEGRAQQKEDEELQDRKRRREHEQQWEATRETRIGSWRDFQKVKSGEVEKKKKKKVKVLG